MLSSKDFVCRLSGAFLGTLSIRDDFSTGRQSGSNNPDDRAGEPVGGSWKPKRPLVLLAHAATTAAAEMTEEQCEVHEQVTTQRRERRSSMLMPLVKRGARCVDEVESEQFHPIKRPRREISSVSNERVQALTQDVEKTINRLVNFERRPQEHVRDPRLQDADFLFNASLRRYVKECLTSRMCPLINVISDLALGSLRVAETERVKMLNSERVEKPLILRVRMREQICNLVVALWTAASRTPYLKLAKRGSDSFRPFCCGVLYALKRGVALPDTTIVVPCVPVLARSLPALRSTASNSVAKALHASSHRGLCTLHRAINSVESTSNPNVKEMFGPAAVLAISIAQDVANERFDI